MQVFDEEVKKNIVDVKKNMNWELLAVSKICLFLKKKKEHNSSKKTKQTKQGKEKDPLLSSSWQHGGHLLLLFSSTEQTGALHTTTQ